MDVNIIDWSSNLKGNDTELLCLFYSFTNIVKELAGGKTVEDLKITHKGESQTSEEGFREFLKSLGSVSWNSEAMSKDHTEAIEKINKYLSVPYKQEEQPINKGGGMMLEDMIQEALDAQKKK